MEGLIDVRIAIVSVDSDTQSYATCGITGSTGCRFDYGWGYTPKIDQSSLGGSPGSVYRSMGQIYGDTIDPYRIQVGGVTCSVDESLQTNANDMVDWNNYGSVRCLVGDGEAGRYNTSFEVRSQSITGPGYGQAFWRRASKQVDNQGNVYHYTQHAAIDELSYTSTGINGGSVLTITGAGFSTRNDNQVYLDNIPCTVIDATSTSIRCRPGSTTQSSPTITTDVFYPGGAGLVHKVYRNVASNLIDPSTQGKVPTFVNVNTNALMGYYYNEDDYYVQTFQGFFIPPVTANYTFYIRGDDFAGIFLSSTPSPANLTRIAFLPGWSTSLWGTTSQVSVPIYLQKNKPYYFYVIHQENAGGDYLDIALRIHTSGNTEAQNLLTNSNQKIFRSVPEVQTLSLTSTIIREKQVIRLVGAAGGTWGIRINNQVWPSSTSTSAGTLAFDAPRWVLESFLYGAGGCTSFSVARTNYKDAATNATGFQYEISWNCPLTSAGTSFPLLQPYSVSLTPAPGVASATFTVYRNNTGNDPLDGSFALTFKGQPTGPLLYSASAGDVQNALMALEGIHDVDVNILGGSNPKDGRTWQITFWNPPGDQPLVTVLTTAAQGTAAGVTGIGLVGSNPGASITVAQNGSDDPFYWPVPMDFFQTAVPLPGVQVYSNGILASCNSPVFNNTDSNRCTFRYDNSLTPTVTTVSKTTVIAGDVIVITGTNFLVPSDGLRAGPRGENITLSDLNKVYFGEGIDTYDTGMGGGICEVTSATATQLTCTVKEGTAGTYPLRVEVGLGRGFATSTVSSSIVISLDITSLTPVTGSQTGGTLLTIVGSGFHPIAANNTVTVGGNLCIPIESTYSLLTCRTPSGTSSSAGTVVNGKSQGTFAYSASLTPSLATALSPTKLSSATSNYINISLSNMATSDTVNSITFGSRSCRIIQDQRLTSTTAFVTCLLTRAQTDLTTQGPYVPIIDIGTKGYVATSSYTLDTGYRVTGISPSSGSLEGGNLITITGVGFTGRLTATTVNFVHNDIYDNNILHHVPCRIRELATDGTYIKCVTGKPQDRVNMTSADPLISGRFEVTVNKFAAPCSPMDNACGYSYSLSGTPIITSVLYTTSNDNTVTAIFTGDRLETDFHVWFGTFMVDDAALTVSNDKKKVTVSSLPEQVAGTVGIFAHSIPLGNVRMRLNYTYPLVLSYIIAPYSTNSSAVPRGSTVGGHFLTIVGNGFSRTFERNIVKINNLYDAVVVDANATHLCIRTPSLYGKNLVTVGGSKLVDISVQVLDVAIMNVTASATLTNAYMYDDSAVYTPTLTRIRPNTGSVGTVLQVTGTGFGSTPPVTDDGTLIFIGGAPCSVLTGTWTTTNFNCTIGNVPAGTHRALVILGNVGLARATSTVLTALTVPLVLTSITPTTMGVGAGLPVTLTGTGFATDETNGKNTINIGDVPCDVTSTTYTSLTCIPRPAFTPAALDLYNTYEIVVLTGTSFGTTPSRAIFAFDNDVATVFKSCTVGLDTGISTRALVTRVRFYPRFRANQPFYGSTFQASNDGNTWTTLATVSSIQVNEGWNFIDIINGAGQDRSVNIGTNQPLYRYLRWNAATNSDCTGMEVQFIGYELTSSRDGTVDVNVTIVPNANAFAGLSQTSSTVALSSGFKFDASLTPTVTSITPNNGTALGGDTIILRGTGFSTSSSDILRVNLNGMPCQVVSSTLTSITCITSPRTSIMEPSVEVVIQNKGLALYNISTTYYRYLDRWSALTTWADQEPPIEGDTVWVPIGQSILVDISPPQLFLVLVQGEMVFDRQDLTFDASYILVHGGRLEVGTEAQPFTNKLTITLHGDRYKSIEIPEVGAKCLAVMNRGGMAGHSGTEDGHTTMLHSEEEDELTMMSNLMFDMMGNDHGMDMSKAVTGMAMTMSSSTSSASLGGVGTMHSDMPGVAGAPAPALTQGILDIHGIPRQRVWTKVAETVLVGTTIVRTAEDVDYAAGETIVVTAGSYDYSEAEERIVVSRPDARTIIVDEPFTFTHESRIINGDQYGHSNIDMRCEVGLLTRNVVIRGDDRSVSQAFGVHTGAFHGGLYRLENAELFHCGQSFNLGRYCSHYHMHGDAVDGYIRSNSIHHSFQRAITIHGTNHLRVMHNFGYNIRGHSIFVEDGVERWNVIEGNLIAVTLRCFACLKSDTKPASFWMASPTNFWRHNVAAGSQNDGYWFEPPGNPNGPSFTPTYCPIGSPVGQYFNNTAHSNGVHGLRIYPMYTPFVDPCNPNSGSSPQYFHNFTSFRNMNHGIFGKHNGDLHHVNPKLVENLNDDYFQIKYLGSLSFTWDPNIKNGLFIATTDPVNRPAWDKRAIFAPQNEYWYVSGATIVNYGNNGAIASCAECDSQQEFRQGAYTYRFDRLQFINSAVRTYWSPPKKDIYWDVDGSLTNQNGGGWVLPRYKFNDWPECPVDTVGTYQGGNVCNKNVQVRRLQIDSFTPTAELQFKTMNVTSSVGSDDILFRPKELYGWTIPLVNTHWYSLQFETLVDWRTFRLRYSEPEYITNPEWTGTSWSWIDSRYRIRSLYRGTNEVFPSPAGTLPSPTDMFGTGNMPSGPLNNTWSVMLSTNLNGTDPMNDKGNSYSIQVAAIQCPPFGCGGPSSDGLLGPPKLWSDASIWPNNQLPTVGMDITINASMYIIMDINPPKLGKIVIEGRLEFQDSGPRKLEADTITVWGSLIIGTVNTPFLNPAEVVLYGSRTSATVVVDNNLFVGNKVLLVLGQVSFHGAVRASTWTKLETSALKGSTSLRLNSSVTGVWNKGDTIVLTPTEYDYNQVESVVIDSVSADGKTLTLTTPLQYSHFAGFAGTNAASPIGRTRLAGAVGLLSRNILIRGNLVNNDDRYGGHVFVTAIKRVINNKDVLYGGTLNARFTEFRNLGKGEMEHAAVRFQYGNFDLDPSITPDATEELENNGYNSIIGCSFSSSFNYGIVAVHARHLFIDRNVFFRTFRNGIDIDKDSLNATVTWNLFAGNFLSPDVNAPGQQLWIYPQAAIYLNIPITRLENNYVGGAYDAAYTLRGDDCAQVTSKGSSFMNNNEAVGVLIGAFILYTPTASGCVFANGFRVWKAAHIGILTVDQKGNFRVNGTVVSDSHIGMSFNYMDSKKGEARSEVFNSMLIGSSTATTLGETFGASGCSQSVVCRAMTMTDITALSGTCGSVYGPTVRRIGIMLPQHTNRGKTCEVDGGLEVCNPVNRPERLCGFPWENRFGLPSTRNTHMYLDNVVFAEFGGANSECGNRDSRAIAHNPTQVDMAVPVTASRITWSNVPVQGRYRFNTGPLTNDKCVDGKGCDSINFILIHDKDGTLTNVPKTTIIGPSPALAEPSPTCIWRQEWPGAECPGLVYRAAIIENMDRDRGFRKLGNLQVTRIAENPNEDNRTVTATGPIDDSCAKRFYFGQYPFAVRPNKLTRIMWPATEPGQTRLHFLSPDPTEKLLVKMFIQRPNTLDIFVDGNKINPKDTTANGDPILTESIGTNIFNPQERELTIVLGGSTNNLLGNGAVWFDIVRNPSVQITLKLSVSMDQFFNSNGGTTLINSLATLLNIDASRIKIVDVKPVNSIIGRRLQSNSNSSSSSTTTALKVEILPPPSAVLLVTDTNDNATVSATLDAQQDMVNLAMITTTLVQSNTLQSVLQTNLGYGVSGIVVEAPIVAAAVDTSIPLTPDSGTSTNSLTAGSIAGIVIGSVVGIVAVAGIGLLLLRTWNTPNIASASVQPKPDPDNGEFSTQNPHYGHNGTVTVVNLDEDTPTSVNTSIFAPGVSRNSVRIVHAPVQVGGTNPNPPSSSTPAPSGTNFSPSPVVNGNKGRSTNQKVSPVDNRPRWRS